MQDYFERPDGEVFADIPTKSIPPADTWHTLPANQLLEIQTTLTSMFWELGNSSTLAPAFSAAIQRLQTLLTQKQL
ncbi:MAG: hypothetical protein DDT31_00301 [Syntrophomonadaceae bacterium]|nr:hypothetical protein [Bacillota bacterium]